MKKKNPVFLLLLSLILPLTAAAQSVDEARQFAEDGNLNEAVTMLQAVTAADPKDHQAALLLADLLWNSGHDAEADAIYQDLRKKGVRQATLALARIAMSRYDTDGATALLEAYRKSLRQGKRQVAEDESGDLEDRIDRIAEMLDRVQNIEVIDSVDVDAEDFFRQYPLSSAAGRLGGPEMLPEGFPSAPQTMVYVPESGNRMIWSAPDSDGNLRLMGSSALLDGEWEEPLPLGEDLGDGGDAAYPYLMPDGITLYYSNDGDASLGGYDIFLTRRGEDGFLQPANVGMPFNSPYNDYLLVIDEFTGAGWFATDRNRHPGKITIYTFIPQDLRINVSPDNPNLASLARLDNISLTQKEDADYAAVRQAIRDGHAMNTPADLTPDFLFALPGNRVYTSLDDFANPKAREAMKTYLEKEQKFNSILDRLSQLRRKYASGDRSQASVILQIENSLPPARAELASLREAVIRLEPR